MSRLLALLLCLPRAHGVNELPEAWQREHCHGPELQQSAGTTVVALARRGAEALLPENRRRCIGARRGTAVSW